MGLYVGMLKANGLVHAVAAQVEAYTRYMLHDMRVYTHIAHRISQCAFLCKTCAVRMCAVRVCTFASRSVIVPALRAALASHTNNV